MTVTVPTHAPDSVLADIAVACDRIAPTWPLDQFVAVNPYWGWRAAPAPDAAARLGVLAGTSLTMPRSWFREEWAAGRLAPEHLAPAAAELGEPSLAGAARAVLDDGEPSQPPLPRLALMTDLRDLEPGPVPGRRWTELVAHQIGQSCAAAFDEWQASWTPSRDVGVFEAWRSDPSVTHGFRWRHGRDWARAQLDTLPHASVDAIASILDELCIPEIGRASYLTALLTSVNGWAAWCAYRRWRAHLAGADDDTIVELLAVRLAWEWLLAADQEDAGPGGAGAAGSLATWAASWAHVHTLTEATADQQRVDWVLQAAIERTYQDTIIRALPGAAAPIDPPEVQAVVLHRRPLGSVPPRPGDGGTAGADRWVRGVLRHADRVRPAGQRAWAASHLPGAPQRRPSRQERVGGRRRHGRGDWPTRGARAGAGGSVENGSSWRRLRCFAFVEAVGLVYGCKLLSDSFG